MADVAAQKAAGTVQKRLPANVRQAQILAAARQAFLEHGLKAKTKDMAKAAGVAESIIFRHFPTKEALFDAAVIEPLEGMLNELLAICSRLRSQDPASRRETMEDFHEEILDMMIEVMPLLGTALFSDMETGRRFYQTRLAPLLESVYRAIDAGLQGWRHPDVDAKYLAIALLGSYAWAALDATSGVEPFDRQACVRNISGLFFRGLGGRDDPSTRPRVVSASDQGQGEALRSGSGP